VVAANKNLLKEVRRLAIKEERAASDEAQGAAGGAGGGSQAVGKK